MKKKDLETLIGETMEDMGLMENIENLEDENGDIVESEKDFLNRGEIKDEPI